MSNEWVQQRRDELNNIVETIPVRLDTEPHGSTWWCPRCHTQITGGESSVEKHYYSCKLTDVVPKPKDSVSNKSS